MGIPHLHDELRALPLDLGYGEVLRARVPQPLHLSPELGLLDREAAKLGDDGAGLQPDVVHEHPTEQVQRQTPAA